MVLALWQVRFEGRTLAVVQCYNKLGRSGTADVALAFSPVDEALLRLVAAHAGALLQKALEHQAVAAGPAQLVKFLSVTHAYPCDALDLYAIAMAQLNQVRCRLAYDVGSCFMPSIRRLALLTCFD